MSINLKCPKCHNDLNIEKDKYYCKVCNKSYFEVRDNV